VDFILRVGLQLFWNWGYILGMGEIRFGMGDRREKL